MRNIRTYLSQITSPSKAYLRLACMEGEKVRCGIQSTNARQKISDIDDRLKEMGAEKAAVLRALEGPPNGGRPAARRSTGGFKLRY